MKLWRRFRSDGVLVFMTAMMFIGATLGMISLKIAGTQGSAAPVLDGAVDGESAGVLRPPGKRAVDAEQIHKILDRASALSSWENWSARTAARAQKSAPKLLRSAVSNTLWHLDGSIVRLEASGRARRFYYSGSGAGSPLKGEELVFEGVREGQTLLGLAYAYSGKCKPAPYKVIGNISPEETVIRLHGKTPEHDVHCNVSGYADRELNFNIDGKS